MTTDMIRESGHAPEEGRFAHPIREAVVKNTSAGRETLERDLHLFMGPRAEKYLGVFRRADFGFLGDKLRPRAGRGLLSWHWPAFLVPIPWLFYRKLYIEGAAILAVFMLVPLVLPAAGYSGAAAAVVIAMIAKRLYVEHALKRIRHADTLGLAPQAREEYLRRAGGVSVPGAVLGSLFPLLGAIAVIFMMTASGQPAAEVVIE